VVVERGVGVPEFGFHDLETLSGIAGQAAIALWHARRRLTARRLRIAEDLQQAREIQRGFLPSLPPTMGRLRVASAYRPAFAVGGDFFDVVEAPDGAITIIVGDVAGSGVAAALLMSRISSDVRRLARDGRQPAEILEEISRTLHESAPDHGFVTASCLRVDITARTALLATAAHLPLLLRRANKRVELHRGQAGLPLGIVAGERWPEVALPLEIGDVLILCTDGVVEALSHEASPAGVLKLASIVKDAPLPVDKLAATVLAAIDSSERAHIDDLTLLVLEVAE
jgi:phosphoserine phosphatase RsbU/P